MLQCIPGDIALYPEPCNSTIRPCAGVANGAFPALVVQSCLTAGQVTLGLCARFLLATMVLTAAAKVALERVSAEPAYPRRRGLAMIGEGTNRPAALVANHNAAYRWPPQAESSPHVRAMAP